MSQTWNEVNKELHRRRDILVRRSHDTSFPMDQLERNRIQSVLEHWAVPQRPTNIPALMKQFCVSAYSYAPLRNNFMKPFAEGLPTRENVAKALSRAFSTQEFLNDSNWLPERLCILAAEIQKERCFDLSSKQFLPRVVAVLLTGSRKFLEELGTGLDNFYERISRISTPPAMWDSGKLIFKADQPCRPGTCLRFLQGSWFRPVCQSRPPLWPSVFSFGHSKRRLQHQPKEKFYTVTGNRQRYRNDTVSS